MRYFFAVLFTVGFLSFIFVSQTNSVYGAILEFNPATKTAAVGDTINVEVKINTGTVEVRSSDAFVLYDSSYLEAPVENTITNGTFFTTVFKTVQATNIYVAGLEDTGSVKKGSGTIATIPFKTKKNGSTTLTFICGQGGATDSTIIKAQGSSNVIECSKNGTSVITIGTGGGGTGSTPTPTPTASAGGSTGSTGNTGGTNPTATPLPTYPPTVTPTTPTQLPQSGIPVNMTTATSIGAIMLLLGIGVRMLL